MSSVVRTQEPSNGTTTSEAITKCKLALLSMSFSVPNCIPFLVEMRSEGFK